MDLSWADLTDEERERVTEVFTIARGRERLLYRQISRREGHDLIGEFEAFAKVIDGLSVEAKQILGPFRPETITGEFVPQSALEQIRHHVAFLISCHDPKAGRARQFAREEAVSELRKTWIRLRDKSCGKGLKRSGAHRLLVRTRFPFFSPIASCISIVSSKQSKWR
jgi:hypothetical protein